MLKQFLDIEIQSYCLNINASTPKYFDFKGFYCGFCVIYFFRPNSNTCMLGYGFQFLKINFSIPAYYKNRG